MSVHAVSSAMVCECGDGSPRCCGGLAGVVLLRLWSELSFLGAPWSGRCHSGSYPSSAAVAPPLGSRGWRLGQAGSLGASAVAEVAASGTMEAVGHGSRHGGARLADRDLDFARVPDAGVDETCCVDVAYTTSRQLVRQWGRWTRFLPL